MTHLLMPMCAPGRIVFNVHPAGPSWLRVAHRPERVGEARRFVARMLAGSDPGLIEDAELVASELVTNSLNHALSHGPPPSRVAPGIWLGVQPLKRFVHLYVRDPYPALPAKVMATETDTHGRGLLIAEALTAALWVDSRSFDKTVHAVIARPGVALTEAELDRLR
jgi:hypothetical protein